MTAPAHALINSIKLGQKTTESHRVHISIDDDV